MKAFIAGVVCAASLVVVGVTPGAAAQAAVAGKESASDARIAQRFKADPTLKKYNIRVNVDGNVATLSGTVATEADRAKASQLAKVEGITRVDNQIVVDLDAGMKGTAGTTKDKPESSPDPSGKAKGTGETATDATKKAVSKTGEAITDGWITSRIKTDFLNEDLLKNSAIEVDTRNNVVTLSGTVPSASGRSRAVAIAKGTEGVKNVVDKLTVGPKKSPGSK
jgi:hyperosmotically inducible protein